MWIFGYGSLMWKVDFPYEMSLIGYVKGYERKFWQLSPDHRGVPEKPGRVVTLVPSADQTAQVYGISYKIAEVNISAVKNQLDIRETLYELGTTQFFPSDPAFSPFKVYVYFAAADNPYYSVERDLRKIARQIAFCKGSSGSNSEYLFKFAEKLREISHEERDNEVFQLVKAVEEIENDDKGTSRC